MRIKRMRAIEPKTTLIYLIVFIDISLEIVFFDA